MSDPNAADPDSDESRLPGGNVGGAVRVGDTVRRPSGPWTPAVHALLDHLHRAGLDLIPRVLGIDGFGREILTYIPGRSVDPDDETVDDAILVAAVRWLRRFHDIVRDYRPTGPVAWRGGARALGEDEIICHHDPAAYNWIIHGDALAGVIDWDLAGPGRPIDDLAFIAWNSVPLYRPVPIGDVVRRMTLMAQAYGGVRAAEILAHVDPRMTRATDRIQAGQEAGDEGMLNLARIGEPDRTRRRLIAMRRRTPDLAAALRSRDQSGSGP